jgi:hypothetical protein
MLDLTTEKAVPLGAATALVPPGRNGKRCHLSTLLRWIVEGVKGPDGGRVRLEVVRLGGRWVTSREALQRFAERLTPRLDGPAPAAPLPPARRRAAAARDAAELDRVGI